jgi:dTDP-glucose 4,6-dehydratase
MKLLVCGGMGFIGSAFIRNHLNKNPNDQIVNLDNLTTGSNVKNLEKIDGSNYQFINGDIKNHEDVNKITNDIDVIVNFAAETHVDRSIANPKQFLETNILGTYTLLEAAKKHETLFVHVSTDEIYGDAVNQDSFNEKSILKPSNPYSASKAAADHLVNSYARTYGIKCIITRCTNNFGPFQFPEKLIPKTIIRAQKNLKVPLYGDGNQIRSWIYVLDHVSAIDSLITKGELGEIYNITSWNEITNRTIVEKILSLMEKPNAMIEYVGDRPGHDKRYSIDSSKIQNEIGWKPAYDFDNAIKQTVDWYLKNKDWWETLADEKMLHPQPWTISW